MMRQGCRARLRPTAIVIAVAGLVALSTLHGSSRMSWGASDSPQGRADTEEAVRLDQVVVSASRIEQKLRDVPANVTVVTKQDIQKSAATTIDDLLRQIPGFSMFRRTSSLVSNPASQGVSLRGIAPTAASRTLVLLDGIPLNDAFGGWVSWAKVPLESIERIEVTRGGGSGVYGNYAVGGVIDIITKRPEAGFAQGKLDIGTRNTVDADLLVSHVSGPWAASLEGNFFRTDGWKIIREDQRGAVDIEADSSHETFTGRVEYSPMPDSSFFLGGSYFNEDRQNGTPLKENSTETGYLATGGRLKTAGDSDWQLSLFSHMQTFRNTFSRIYNNRNSEALTIDQQVPAYDLGGSLQWTKRIFSQHLVTAGIDARRIDGESDDKIYNAAGTAITTLRNAGGVQNFFGLFAQDIIMLTSRLELTAALRFDYWRNSNGFLTETDLSGKVTQIDFKTKNETNLSPKVALLYRPVDELSLRGSYYEGFRAPTLDELFRSSRVQQTVTIGNSGLGPERLMGGEIGADYVPAPGWLAKLTGFWNELEDPISNVTLAQPFPKDCGTPAPPVCRQKKNLGRTRSRGVEAELRYSPAPEWEFSASYLYNESTVIENPVDPSLVGKRLPQVPEHAYTVGVRYLNPAIVNASVQGRFMSAQFEDDQNTTEMGSFFVVDLMLWRPISIPKMSGGEVFLGIENLFDTTYAVGIDPSTGVVTTGTPLLVHGGLRARF